MIISAKSGLGKIPEDLPLENFKTIFIDEDVKKERFLISAD
jgi:hypothetical protein